MYLLSPVSLSGFLLLFIQSLVISLSAHAAPDHEEPDYAGMRLTNGTELVAFSSPDMDQSKMVLKVASGSFSDSAAFPGMAHLLEHLLLRQPVNETGQSLRQWVQQQGGKLNATTGYDNTIYEFLLPPQAQEAGIGHLSKVLRQFQAAARDIEQEIPVLEQEFALRRRQPLWQQRDVLKAVTHPAHAYGHWHPGNRASLLHRGIDTLGQAVDAHFTSHYTPDRLRLVLTGPAPADQQLAAAHRHFSFAAPGPGHQNHNSQSNALPRQSVPLFQAAALPVTLSIPANRQRIMTLLFPVAGSQQAEAHKAVDYLGYLLTRRQDQGLLRTLQQAGLAGGLIAGRGIGDQQHSSFHITMSLTQKGWDNQPLVLATVYRYIHLMQREALKEPVLEGFFHTRQLQHLIADQQDSLEAILQRLLNEPLDSITRCPPPASPARCHAGAEFGKHFTALLSALKGNNQIRILQDSQLVADQHSPLFNTPYRRTKDSEEPLTSTQIATMVLPVTDPYIQELAAQHITDPGHLPDPEELPVKIRDEGNITVWYDYDHHKGKPLAEVRLLINNPELASSPLNSALSRLYTIALQERLQGFQERIADLFYEFEVKPHPQGFYIEVRGYSRGVTDIVNYLLTRIQEFEPAGNGLARWKARLAAQLQNQSRYGFEELYEHLYSQLLDNYWPREPLLAAADSVTAEQLQLHRAHLLTAHRITAFYHGNLPQNQAETIYPRLQQLVRTDVADTNLKEPSPVNAQRMVYPLPKNHYQVITEHKDNAMVMFHQADNNSPRTNSIVQLIRELMHKEYFHSLRTQQGLGYAVFVAPMNFYTHAAFAVTIQSARTSTAILESQTNRFLSNFSSYLNNLDEAEFNRFRQSAENRLSWHSLSTREKTDRLWKHIQSGTLPDPDIHNLNIISAISLQEIRNYYQENLTGKNRKLFVFASQPGQ